jgi:hypothetical protein
MPTAPILFFHAAIMPFSCEAYNRFARAMCHSSPALKGWGFLARVIKTSKFKNTQLILTKVLELIGIFIKNKNIPKHAHIEDISKLKP